MERPRLNEGASIDDFVAKLKRVVFPSVFELKFELELWIVESRMPPRRCELWHPTKSVNSEQVQAKASAGSGQVTQSKPRHDK